MPTVDIVSELDMQQMDNAVNVTNKRIGQRYDFKGLEIELELNKKDKVLRIVVPDESKLRALQEILLGAMHDQGISPKVVDWGKHEDASLGAVRLNCKLREGIEKELAKTIVKKIKDSGLKVKASIQGEQVRLEGKKIDDLQEIMAKLRAEEFDTPLQFTNMKR